MKKILMVAVVAIVTTVGVCAQTSDEFKRHEVALSVGAWSNSQILSAFEHIGSVIVTAGTTSFQDESYVGPIAAEYFYHPKAWLGVGGIAAFGMNKQDAYFGGTYGGELKDTYYTLMPAVKFDWLRGKHFGMYSKAAVGATLRTEKYDDKSESTVHFNWQASLLGMEVGSPQVRFFAELGFGEQGIFAAGLRYKF